MKTCLRTFLRSHTWLGFLSSINTHIRRRQWHPTPVLLPGKSHGRRAWWAVVHGVARSQTRLSDFTFTFHFHALEKEMATHSSVLAWRIPGTGETRGLPSMGSHRVRHDWSDLAVAAPTLSHFWKCQGSIVVYHLGEGIKTPQTSTSIPFYLVIQYLKKNQIFLRSSFWKSSASLSFSWATGQMSKCVRSKERVRQKYL